MSQIQKSQNSMQDTYYNKDGERIEESSSCDEESDESNNSGPQFHETPIEDHLRSKNFGNPPQNRLRSN